MMGVPDPMNPNQIAEKLSRRHFKFHVMLLCSFSAAALVGANQTFAQRDPELLATYGRGVHEYFSGNTQSADQYFTQVIEAGSSDPRVYYFRAMARLRMGSTFWSPP